MSGDRARLFVALELTAKVRGALSSWREEAVRGETAGPHPRLRLVSPEQLHVTLCFLGWQEAADAQAIGQACTAAMRGQPQLLLAEAIWLPSRRPRVLAVRLDDPDGELGAIQAALSASLQAGGWYEPEARPFLPHVTVARVPARGGVRTGPLPPLPRIGFRGRELTLYRSHLARAGARYEALTQFALAAPDRPGS